MICSKCGDDNSADNRFCGGCGASLSTSEPNVIDFASSEPAGSGNIEATPDNATAVRQSHWAYLWPAVPWLVLFGVSIGVDFFTFGTLPAVIAIIFVGSRYLSYRRTVYILGETNIIIQQGTFMGQNVIDLEISDLNEVLIQPGMFGRSLGYARVNLQLRDGQLVFLHYVPSSSPLVDHLQQRMDPPLPVEDEPNQ